MEEAIERLKLAAAAGADVCFIEGVKSKELLESTVAALAPIPVLVNVISGGLTPPFTYREAEQMGAKIISSYPHLTPLSSSGAADTHFAVFSLVSCVAMVHACRAAMHSLKKTGTDFVSAQGMDPKEFFKVMGTHVSSPRDDNVIDLSRGTLGLDAVIELDAKAGGSAFEVV